ncbi:MAG: SMP-30/gluconolactonase/LRE family protein, partial [Nocardiopsaceae bacterium]|nr:SMP-30/gluconolactonase/LRE family protein [Nocardiopsaceae bacterium]
IATGPSTTQAPEPAPRSFFSRKNLIITAAAALVVAVAGTLGGVFLTKSGGDALSLRATLTNPGKVPANALEFSPDNSTLVATDNAHAATAGQNSASVFNTSATAGMPGFSYDGLGNDLAYSPDGTRLAIAGAYLYVYNAANHSPVAYIPNVSPQAVAFGQSGQGLAVGGRWTSTSSEEVGLLNPATRQWTATMSGLPKNSYINALAYAPDGTTLAASDAVNGQLYVWNTSSRSLVTTPVPLTAATGPIAFSHDGKTLAVATGGTGSVRLWNVDSKTWSGAAMTDAKSKGVKGIAYSPDGKTLAVADGNGTVNLWDTATGKLIIARQVNPKGVASVTFSPDGKALATGDAAGQIELWAVSGQ